MANDDEEDVPEGAVDPEEGTGTTTTRWRWKGLSTVVALFLVVQFPAFLVVSAVYGYAPDGTVVGTLAFAWFVGIGYSVGTDIVKDIQEIRGA